MAGGMRLSPMTRCALVLIPLLVCAGRLHARRSAAPEGMTQEVNRCLSVVRAATSRRRHASELGDRVMRLRNGIALDGAAAYGGRRPRARTA